jgi:Domain of unknown function (DUF3291)
VWRLQAEAGDSLAVDGFNDEQIIGNLSVWESIDQFADFVIALRSEARRTRFLAKMRRDSPGLVDLQADDMPEEEECGG